MPDIFDTISAPAAPTVAGDVFDQVAGGDVFDQVAATAGVGVSADPAQAPGPIRNFTNAMLRQTTQTVPAILRASESRPGRILDGVASLGMSEVGRAISPVNVGEVANDLSAAATHYTPYDPETVSGTLGEAAGSVAKFVPAVAYPPLAVPLLTTAGVEAAGNQYLEVDRRRAQGQQISENMADLNALGVGGVEAGTEALGLKFLGKAGKIGKQIASRAFGKAAGQAAGAVAGEAGEEVIAQTGQNLIDKATILAPGEQRGVFEGAGRAALLGGLAGAGVVGPGAVLTARARSNRLAKLKAYRAERAAAGKDTARIDAEIAKVEGGGEQTYQPESPDDGRGNPPQERTVAGRPDEQTPVQAVETGVQQVVEPQGAPAVDQPGNVGEVTQPDVFDQVQPEATDATPLPPVPAQAPPANTESAQEAQAAAMSGRQGNWREVVDSTDDIDRRGDILRAIAGKRGAEGTFDDVLDRAEQLNWQYGDEGGIFWAVMQNPTAPAKAKARAAKLREAWENRAMDESKDVDQPGEQKGVPDVQEEGRPQAEVLKQPPAAPAEGQRPASVTDVGGAAGEAETIVREAKWKSYRAFLYQKPDGTTRVVIRSRNGGEPGPQASIRDAKKALKLPASYRQGDALKHRTRRPKDQVLAEKVEKSRRRSGILDTLKLVYSESLGDDIRSARDGMPMISRINSAKAMEWARKQPEGSRARTLAYLYEKAKTDPPGTTYDTVDPSRQPDGTRIVAPGGEVFTVDQEDGEVKDGITAPLDQVPTMPAKEVLPPKQDTADIDAFFDDLEKENAKTASTSDTGIFGQEIFRPATGSTQGGLFHEPVTTETPQSERVGSRAANDPANTPSMFPRGRDADIASPTAAPRAVESLRPQTADAPRTIVHPVSVPELFQLAKDILANPPVARRLRGALGVFRSREGDGGKVEINRSLGENPRQLAAVLAHEIGHAVDFLDDKTMKRGNLLGRVASLRSHLAHAIESPEGAKVDLKTVKNELWELSKWWRPTSANPDKAELAYRKGSRELYADALSVLLNSPGHLKERAPTFYKAFFDFLDRKPNVRAEYFKLQDTLNGIGDDLSDVRRRDVREMFAKGEDAWRARHAEANDTRQSVVSYIRQLLFDRSIPILSMERKSKPSRLPWDETLAAKHAMEEFHFRDNPIRLLADDVQKQVMQPLADAGLDIPTVGEYMMMRRIAEGDRGGAAEQAQQVIMGLTGESTWTEAKAAFAQTVADDPSMAELLELASSGKLNPLGYTPEAAREYLSAMKRDMGGKLGAMERAVARFRDLVWEQVEQAVEAGTYNREMVEKLLRPNKDFYATFAVTMYLDTKIKAGIYRQVGTFSDIANPYTATLMKTVSLIRLNEFNKAKRAIVDFLSIYHPGDIGEGQKIDQYHRLKPPREGRDHIIVLENGKPVAYEVDAYIAKAFATHDLGALSRFARWVSSATYRVFHPLWIAANPSWQVMNVPRDVARTYQNVAALHANKGKLKQLAEAFPDIGRVIAAYYRAVAPAMRRARGRADPIIRKLEELRAIGTPFTKATLDDDAEQVQRTLAQAGVLPKKKRGAIARTLGRVYDGLESFGTFLETLPKVAMYDMGIRAGIKSERELAYIVRNYSGTPNTKRRGLVTDLTNAIAPYSNVVLQGWRADAEIAANPSTAAGRWMRAALVNYLPKLAAVAAAAGLFGDELEEFFQSIPEYEKAKYTIVPLGWSTDDNGNRKAAYLRLPHADTDRVVAASLWKLMSRERGTAGEAFGTIMGELPGTNPYVEMASKWTEYLAGQTPRDDFRGRDILSRDERLVGGWPAAKKMVEWTSDQTGVMGQLIRSTTVWNKPDEQGKPQTTTEKVVRAIPGLSAIVRVSDRGISERQWKDVEAEDAEKADVRLKMPANVKAASQERYRLNRLGKERITPEQNSRRQLLNRWYGQYLNAQKLIARAEAAGDTKAADDYRRKLEAFTDRRLRTPAAAAPR